MLLRKRRSDVSFITKDNRLIIMIEYQSTINLNMAFRLLLYYFELVQLWIKFCGISIFGGRPVPPLPEPEFYVAYNGKQDIKECISSFRLACKFLNVQVDVRIVDIRYGKLATAANTENALAGYSFLYREFDRFVELGMPTAKAFEAAVESCKKEGYLKEILGRDDFVINYKDWLDYDVQLRAEALDEGIVLGKAVGMAEGFKNGIEKLAILIKDGLTVGEALLSLKAEMN